MASKYRLESSDIYLPGTDIPRNLADITDTDTLHEIERELLAEAYRYFHEILEESTRFDEAYFVHLHNATFSSLYEWAGRYRHFNMAKGESRFCQGAYIRQEARKIFSSMKEENYLRDYSEEHQEVFANRLAHYQCELIALHPFYELNGRITRLFFDMIATYNGYNYIDYSIASADGYIDASIDCVQLADCSKLETIILQGLSQ